MNMLVASQYQSRLSSITKIFSRRISQSDRSIQIKLNYYYIIIQTPFSFILITKHIRTTRTTIRQTSADTTKEANKNLLYIQSGVNWSMAFQVVHLIIRSPSGCTNIKQTITPSEMVFELSLIEEVEEQVHVDFYDMLYTAWPFLYCQFYLFVVAQFVYLLNSPISLGYVPFDIYNLSRILLNIATTSIKVIPGTRRTQ